MTKEKQSICVVGLGYIGLPTASLLGTKGFNVLGVDNNSEIVDTINQGKIHIVEPDLDILVKSAVGSKNLKASLEPEIADMYIIAVPTPFLDNHQPDLSYVTAATHLISPYVRPGNLIILESTSPVGTTQNIVVNILKQQGLDVDNDIYVAHCPERVLPGRILTELVENDRIVGGVNAESTKKAVEFYRSFVRGKVIATDAKTAEMTKLTENSFRDVNIAFANELSYICEQEDINVWDLIKLANRHPRVNILKPGPGVGGHCIAVDPWFIVSKAPEHSKLIQTAREINDSKPKWIIDKIKVVASKFKNPIIGCLGLAFKSDIDDLRESPSLAIVQALNKDKTGQLLVSEPNLTQHDEFELLAHEEVINQADIVVVLVDHSEYLELTLDDFKEKILIDTRGIIN